jgi:hypothetical protein
MGLRMQPRSEKFFTLISKAGPNVVESAASLTEFVAALHERWAERSVHGHHETHEHEAGSRWSAVGSFLYSRYSA